MGDEVLFAQERGGGEGEGEKGRVWKTKRGETGESKRILSPRQGGRLGGRVGVVGGGRARRTGGSNGRHPFRG